MTAPAHPGRTLLVALPVADLARSRDFFVALGFTLDPHFSNASTASVLVGEGARIMLLDGERFAEFSHRPAADPRIHAQALFTIGVASREEVDAVGAAALAAGAVEADGLEDHGFMCSRSFFDLDGHGWQVMWMDPVAAQQGPEAYLAAQQDADAPA